MLDVGRWILDVGRWILDVGRWMLDVGRWMLDIGCWMVDITSMGLRCHHSRTFSPKKKEKERNTEGKGHVWGNTHTRILCILPEMGPERRRRKDAPNLSSPHPANVPRDEISRSGEPLTPI